MSTATTAKRSLMPVSDHLERIWRQHEIRHGVAPRVLTIPWRQAEALREEWEVIRMTRGPEAKIGIPLHQQFADGWFRYREVPVYLARGYGAGVIIDYDPPEPAPPEFAAAT